jgi:transposase InsO family protein
VATKCGLAYAESFNASVRLECLGQHRFLDLDDAREKVEEWRTEYNEVGGVAKLVGIEGGVVSGCFNPNESSVDALDRRPRHDGHYHEVRWHPA